MPLSNAEKLRLKNLNRAEFRAIYLGIDPGESGGMVALLHDGRVIGTPMPPTELDIWNWMRLLTIQPGQSKVVAAVEKVGGFIKGNPSPGSAMFKFGKSYGTLRMGLTALGSSWEDVTPQRWQKEMGFPVRQGEKSPERKERLRAFAQRLFPDLETWSLPGSFGKQRAVCDALIIAEWCRRKHQGRI